MPTYTSAALTAEELLETYVSIRQYAVTYADVCCRMLTYATAALTAEELLETLTNQNHSYADVC
jgi:hypothetical protein